MMGKDDDGRMVADSGAYGAGAASLMPCPEGSTRVYAIAGDPVVQVKAPTRMNAWFARQGVNAVMVPLHIPAGRFDAVFAGIRDMQNIAGMLVTVPHKFAAAGQAERRSPAVVLTGAANALRREADGTWSAENFDGSGFVAGLCQQGKDPRGMRVLLVGTGGAGVAIALALVQAGVASLVLLDRDGGKAEHLARKLDDTYPGVARAAQAPVWRDFDLAINATPSGLEMGDPLPFDPSRLSSGAIVADIIMKPHQTRLLQLASDLGLPVHHGIHMLECQLDDYVGFLVQGRG